MVNNPQFTEAIKEKIGSTVDTTDMEKQIEALQLQLRQALGTKVRLERQMDSLDITDKYYDRKILDLQRRYDEQYGRIEEIEIQLDDIQSQIRNIRQEKIFEDNIYQLLLAFDEVYSEASEVERKEFFLPVLVPFLLALTGEQAKTQGIDPKSTLFTRHRLALQTYHLKFAVPCLCGRSVPVRT